MNNILTSLFAIHISVCFCVAQTSTGTFQSFGLGGTSVTALTTEFAGRGIATPKRMLFAGTEKDGVFQSPAFDATNSWTSLGFEGKEITAMTVKHWGRGPIDGLQLLVGIKPRQTTRDTLVFVREVGVNPDNAWVGKDSGIDKKKLTLIKAMNSFYTSGHEPLLPVFVGGDRAMYASMTGFWNDVFPNEPWKINSIDLHPHWRDKRNDAYAVGQWNLSPALYRSTDFGVTWERNVMPLMIEGEAFSVAINPRFPDSLYVGMQGGVWISSDAGKTWKQNYITAMRVQFTRIAIDPRSPQNIFIGGADDQNRFVMFQTFDGGKSWMQYNPPIRMILSGITSIIAMHPDQKNDLHVFISTLGTGVWLYKPSFTTGVTAEAIEADDFQLHQNYPNPFHDVTTIAFTLRQRSHVDIRIRDALGREVAHVLDGVMEANTQSISWSAQDYPSGVYSIEMLVGKKFIARRSVLIR